MEEYIYKLLRVLLEEDRENEYVLFFNAWNTKTPDISFMGGRTNVTVKTFRIPNKLLNLSLWYFGWPKLDRLIGGVDVYFLPNINFVAVSRDVKFVVTAHDLSFERFPETFSWKTRIWHYLVNFRDVVRRADHILAVSHSTRNDLVELYVADPKKIMVIPSGLDERFHKMKRSDSQLLAVQKNYHLPYKFILYLGTFEPRKNLVSLVRAFDWIKQNGSPEAKKYSLVLAGRPGWKCDDLFRAIKESPFIGDIVLPGYIEDEDKTALYNLATALVYPSLYEGFGFPPLEAIGCGVPVITSHSSSLPEVVGNAGLLIDPYRPDELRVALESVINNRGLREHLQERGLVQAKKFDWHTTARTVLSLWREMGE